MALDARIHELDEVRSWRERIDDVAEAGAENDEEQQGLKEAADQVGWLTMPLT